MERLIIALALGAVVIVFAVLVQRRQVRTTPDAAGEFRAPEHLVRSDFDRPEAPWLVAVFTSATCSTCSDVWAKAKALDSPQVVVQEVEEKIDADLHARYDIRAVPIIAIADSTGRVRSSYMGPVSATHLWAGMAELRDPGSVPEGCGESASGPRGHTVPPAVDHPESMSGPGDVAASESESSVWIRRGTDRNETDRPPSGGD